MASHSEFKELQEAEQHMHLKMTLFPALAITFARGETCNSGEDQLEFYGQVGIVMRDHVLKLIVIFGTYHIGTSTSRKDQLWNVRISDRPG